MVSMEPEKFLTPKEFNALLKSAKNDRERCILLLLAGAGLRVGEMTQIRAEDIDLSKGYLHIQAANAKFNKARTVILMPKVVEVLKMQLDGRSKGWLFPSYRDGHISSRQIQNILDGIATMPPGRVCRRSSVRTRRARTDIGYILICSDTALLYGAWIAECLLGICRTNLAMPLWLPQAFISRPARTTGGKRICDRNYRFSFGKVVLITIF